MRGKRGEIVWDELFKWLVAAGVLVIMLLFYVILSGKGQGIIDYLNRLFRFG